MFNKKSFKGPVTTMDNPLVTIIIPTYNRETVLAEAVTSVLEQTYTNLEIIIVDDGSVDGTNELIQGFKDSRIRYVYQKNQGVSAARNAGLHLAQGDYISFLDSDDLYLPHTIADEVTALSAQGDDVGFVYGLALYSTYNSSGEKTFIKRSPPYQQEGIIAKDLLFEPRFETSAVLFRQHCFKKVGFFNKNLKVMEDTDLFFRISIYFKAVHLNKNLVEKRIFFQGNHLTGTNFRFRLRQTWKFLFYTFKNPTLPVLYQQFKKKAYAVNTLNMGFIAFDEGNYRDIPFILKQSFIFYPLIGLTLRYFKLVLKYSIVSVWS